MGCRVHTCALAVLLVWCACGSARAQTRPEPQLKLPALQEPTLTSTSPVFAYTNNVHAEYLRAGLEELLLLGLGFTEYVVHHDLNSQDWDFTYDWDGLHQKLGPRGYSFDTNGFDTNFTRHPAAGTTYYWAARSNRLSILESTAISMLASLIWEYLGELRERASINDIVVTPLAGVALGEMTLQLGAFFDRSCATLPNRILGDALAPMKALHDWIDGAELARDERCDALGFTERGGHSFRLSAALGPVATVRGPAVPLQLQTRLGLHTRIVAVDSWGADGEGLTTFADGNVSEFRLSSLLGAGTWLDFTLHATVLPFGLHYRSLHAGRGYELLFGLLLGTQYSVHRYGWTAPQTRQRDRFFDLDLPGVDLVYRGVSGAWSLEVELQTSLAMLGVDAFARSAYLRHASADTLPTVAAAEDYNYALGLRLVPRAHLRWRSVELGAELDAVRGTVISVRDRFEDRGPYVHGSELRVVGSAWLSFGPRSWPLRFNLLGSWLGRTGVIDTTHVSRAELRLLGGVGAHM